MPWTGPSKAWAARKRFHVASQRTGGSGHGPSLSSSSFCPTAGKPSLSTCAVARGGPSVCPHGRQSTPRRAAQPPGSRQLPHPPCRRTRRRRVAQSPEIHPVLPPGARCGQLPREVPDARPPQPARQPAKRTERAGFVCAGAPFVHDTGSPVCSTVCYRHWSASAPSKSNPGFQPSSPGTGCAMGGSLCVVCVGSICVAGTSSLSSGRIRMGRA